MSTSPLRSAIASVSDPDAGLNATLVTGLTFSNDRRITLVAAFQQSTLPLSVPAASLSPLLLNATLVTPEPARRGPRIGAPVAMRHLSMTPVVVPAATTPSRLRAMPVTSPEAFRMRGGPPASGQ